jgi:hypothetical protein
MIHHSSSRRSAEPNWLTSVCAALFCAIVTGLPQRLRGETGPILHLGQAKNRPFPSSSLGGRAKRREGAYRPAPRQRIAITAMSPVIPVEDVPYTGRGRSDDSQATMTAAPHERFDRIAQLIHRYVIEWSATGAQFGENTGCPGRPRHVASVEARRQLQMIPLNSTRESRQRKCRPTLPS